MLYAYDVSPIEFARKLLSIDENPKTLKMTHKMIPNLESIKSKYNNTNDFVLNFKDKTKVVSQDKDASKKNLYLSVLDSLFPAIYAAVESHQSSEENLNCFLYYFARNNNLFINNKDTQQIAFLLTIVEDKAIYKVLEKDELMFDSVTKMSSVEEFKESYTQYKSEYSTKHTHF